jgi:hypothetical protein
MDRVSVNSSNVAEIGYDPSSMTLEIAFNNGNVYQYFDVPEAVYDELMRAESIGKFLNANIKDNYRCVRL